MRCLLTLLIGLGLALGALAQPAETVKIGSKAFPESWVLGEAMVALARDAGAAVSYDKNLGATEVIFQALRQGKIDIYPEYAGTIKKIFLKNLKNPSDADVLSALAADGIGMSYPLGFNNGFAMAVPKDSKLKTLSDLAAHPELRIAMSGEFRARQDGWPLLVESYGMKPKSVLELQHELCYSAIAAREVDVINVYTTDGQVSKLGLRALEDDREAFPRYDAVYLYRADLPSRSPKAWAALNGLVGAISDQQMSQANALQVVDKKGDKAAAESLLAAVLPRRGQAPEASVVDSSWNWSALAANLQRHLELVIGSLAIAIAIGIPMGVVASKSRSLATLTLSVTGLLQTVPSLALLAFLIPFLGVGVKAALVALVVYSLLPIVRNTYTGLTTLPGNLSEAAEAIGLTPRSQLFWVRLPMASPSILAGIKTSAVINVGTATLAALVGAGGLGQPIIQGIQLLDHNLILQGAIPAALLALVVQAAFDGLERFVVPRGLRL